MPVLTPTVWIVLIAAALQCATGLGWWITSERLDRAQAKVAECRAQHQAFVDQVERAGRRAAARAQEIENEQRRIADETAQGWAKALDVVRADAARRLRAVAGQGSAGAGGLSAPGQPAARIDERAQIPLPPAERILADCAEDTLMLVWLQDWLRKTGAISPP